jgi:translation initiation factor IF-2
MLPTLPTRRDVEQNGLGQPIEVRAGVLPEHRAERLPDKGKPTAAAGVLSRGARNVGCAEGGGGTGGLPATPPPAPPAAGQAQREGRRDGRSPLPLRARPRSPTPPRTLRPKGQPPAPPRPPSPTRRPGTPNVSPRRGDGRSPSPVDRGGQVRIANPAAQQHNYSRSSPPVNRRERSPVRTPRPSNLRAPGGQGDGRDRGGAGRRPPQGQGRQGGQSQTPRPG